MLFRDGILWVVAANLVVWTGLFLYLLRIDRRVNRR
jgi:CcmD family protein